MSDIAIQVDKLSKRYRIGQAEKQPNGRKSIMQTAAAPFRYLASTLRKPTSDEIIWALKDISFEVGRGEAVGLIGHNGAGKSTLLKILSRITEPTAGEANIYGRVGSLLEVGTGFHPELTGRENTYLNGAILGMKKAEIERKFDEIVDFSGVEKFIDTPVKRYSSGMRVRLAFSVAAHLEPEILLVDEVLAVGDATFQKKCLGKMGEVVHEGRTVLFVSHNMEAVNSLTQKTLYVKNGQLAAYDNSSKVIAQYLLEFQPKDNGEIRALDFYRRELSIDTPVKTIDIWVDKTAKELPALCMGESFTIYAQIQVSQEIRNTHIDITLKNTHGDRITILFSRDQDYVLSLKPGEYVVSVQVDNLILTPGPYFVDVGLNQSVQTKAYDVIRNFPIFRITNQEYIKQWIERPWGVVHCASVNWQLDSES